MNVLLKKREVGFYLSDPEAKLLFAWHDFAEAAEAGAEEAGAELILVKPGEFEAARRASTPTSSSVVDRDDDDTAVILYTSGTTGTPKGAELTHSNLARNVELAVKLFDLHRRDPVILGALPLFHSFGQTCGLNAAIAAGGTLTLIPRFDPGKALEIIERDQRRRVRGRADDVRGDAQPPRRARTSTPPRSSSAPRAARRCRSR